MSRIYTDDPTTSAIIKKKRVILNIKEDSEVSYDEENLPDQVNLHPPDFHSAIFKIFDENEEFIANKAQTKKVQEIMNRFYGIKNEEELDKMNQILIKK